jgi:positive regulator of sigma E activity
MNKRAILFDLFIFICACFSFVVPLLISFIFYLLFNMVGLVELTAPITSVVFIASMFCIAAGLVALREKIVGD